MYIIDFFKNLFKRNNIGTIIWILCNLAVICACSVLLYEPHEVVDIVYGVLIGIAIYILSIVIALSPIGEWILRVQSGCKAIVDPTVVSRMQPIFEEVYSRAKEMNPEIPGDVKLFMNNDLCPNAFATGRHTICITRGLLLLSDNDIKGILGHEFGHLAHKDTDTILVIAVGNLIVSIVFAVWRAIIRLFAWFINIAGVMAAESFWGKLTAWFAGELIRILIDIVLAGVIALWTKLGVLICMTSSRANEYLADQYSYHLGYGYDLCNALRKLGVGEKSKGIFAALSSSHPDSFDRINRLNELTNSHAY